MAQKTNVLDIDFAQFIDEGVIRKTVPDETWRLVVPRLARGLRGILEYYERNKKGTTVVSVRELVECRLISLEELFKNYGMGIKTILLAAHYFESAGLPVVRGTLKDAECRFAEINRALLLVSLPKSHP